MTTGDEEAESLVDNLFREVDDQFKDLEREYHQAREDLATTDDRHGDTSDAALQASNERFELQSQVAALQAEVSRQANELDERDRLLAELGDKIAGFEADIAERDEMLSDLHNAKQKVLDERREQARLSSLLDARAAEREELADVAARLQNERDHVQELLTTALSRFDEVDALRIQLDDKVRHLEAARDTAAREHDSRAHELIESRAEMSKLADKLDDFSRQAEQAETKAEKAEALAERRTNEAGYLNRRIDAMNDKLAESESTGQELSIARRELALAERSNTELERQVDTLQGEAAAAQAAVDAIAERTSDYDELVAQVEQLTEERDAAWEAASGYQAAAEQAVAPAAPAAPFEAESNIDEVASLADRAREMGARRANEAEAAAQAAEEAAATAALVQAAEQEAAAKAPPAPEPESAEEPAPEQEVESGEPFVPVIEAPRIAPDAKPAVPASVIDEPPADELLDLQADDAALIDADLADVATEDDLAYTGESTNEMQAISIEKDNTEQDNPEQGDAEQGSQELPPPPPPPSPEPVAETDGIDIDSIPKVTLDHLDPPVPSVDTATGLRKRAILPADLVPNTPEAVSYLLNQPGVTAIIDARSTCGRTGIRPSELFDRVASLRDRFDVPVEVVVTPVSTPVGGAPSLPAIGVHHVTGADTVADRVRALCMGFPADQPLVVIAGDDHVRRAAIAEEANVVEPASVLSVATD